MRDTCKTCGTPLFTTECKVNELCPRCKGQHDKIDELVNSARQTLHEMLNSAYKTGTLSDEMKEDNFLLPKMIFTIWGNKKGFEPKNKTQRKELENLSHFI